MAGGESEGHRKLKKGAFFWAQAHGYTACAEEVRLPNSGYRADVVACKPPEGEEAGMCAVFECKWARSDFLGDAGKIEESATRLEELLKRREVLERNLRVHRPSLRKGEFLFPEFDVIDSSKVDHSAYRSVIREIQMLQRRLRAGSKFERVARYRCADLCYLVARKGICRRAEIPPGWGLLEWDGCQTATDGASEPDREIDTEIPELSLEIRPDLVACGEKTRIEMLGRIGAAATRLGNRQFDIAARLPFSARRSRAVFR